MLIPKIQTECETKALHVLKRYKITQPWVDVFEIAENEGFTIKYFQPQSAKQREYAGLSKDKVIYLNSEDSPQRQTFTIAHELGHYFLEHNPDDFGVYYRNSFYKEDKPENEIAADLFAAALLMPRGFVIATIKKYNLDIKTSADVFTLARLFGVSKTAMKWRLHNLGL